MQRRESSGSAWRLQSEPLPQGGAGANKVMKQPGYQRSPHPDARGEITSDGARLLGDLYPVADSRAGSAFVKPDIAAHGDRDYAGDGSSVGSRCRRLIRLVGSGVVGLLLNAIQWCDAVDMRRSAARRDQQKRRGGKSGTNSQPKL